MALVGGAVVSPYAVVAQSQSRVWRIGVLGNEPWPPLDGLRQGLQELGYVDGRNLRIEYRFAAGHTGGYAALAAELVSIPADAIVTVGTPASLAAKHATRTIPIVMQSGDPLASGLVSSLAHPGENVTGFSSQGTDAEGKRLELLRELVPALSRVVVLSNPRNPYCRLAAESARLGATALGLHIDVVDMSEGVDLDRALRALSEARADAVLVLGDPFLVSERGPIADVLAANRLPSISTFHEHLIAGGLASYGTDYYDLFRRMASVLDRIFKGANPGDLPVAQPTKFELKLNLKAAAALNLTVPPALLARADEVIE
jgi:putative ABC transport system substrate-binding protein